MYVRPFVFGQGAQIGVGPAPEYKFVVVVVPVGEYYKGHGISGVDALMVERCVLGPSFMVVHVA